MTQQRTPTVKMCVEGCKRPAMWPPRAPVHCCWLCYDRVEQVANIEHTIECASRAASA